MGLTMSERAGGVVGVVLYDIEATIQHGSFYRRDFLEVIGGSEQELYGMRAFCADVDMGPEVSALASLVDELIVSERPGNQHTVDVLLKNAAAHENTNVLIGDPVGSLKRVVGVVDVATWTNVFPSKGFGDELDQFLGLVSEKLADGGVVLISGHKSVFDIVSTDEELKRYGGYEVGGIVYEYVELNGMNTIGQYYLIGRKNG